MTLSQLFENHRDIVINTDIDGFLCGMILQKYYGCRVVGFSNSKETVWLDPAVRSIDDPVYIDLYVARPQVLCVEQHIIAYNRAHHEYICGLGTKLNPNLDRGRTFCGDVTGDYFHKYPFGTCHYLVYLMAREGIDVTFPDLSTPCTYGGQTVQLGQLLLRADDAMYTTMDKYRPNALDWWEYLIDNSGSATLAAFLRYIDSFPRVNAKAIKNKVNKFFRSMGCDAGDGAFTYIDDGDGNLAPGVSDYCRCITAYFGMPLALPTQLVKHTGQACYARLSPMQDSAPYLADPSLYSYAFIAGPRTYKLNFSYTLNMQ